MKSARMFEIATHNMANEVSRLSSGEKVLNATDNAAGIAISEVMRSRIISYGRAAQNALDGQTMLETADGALEETTKILHRMRELVLKGADDAMTISDRAMIAQEINALTADVDEICERTAYNGKQLLAGGIASAQGFTFCVNLTMKDAINVKIGTVDAATLGVVSSNLSVDTVANANVSLANLDKALDYVGNIRSSLGSNIGRLEHAAASLHVVRANEQESQSTIRELDTAAESVRLARDTIISQSSRTMFTQANSLAKNVLDLLK